MKKTKNKIIKEKIMKEEFKNNVVMIDNFQYRKGDESLYTFIVTPTEKANPQVYNELTEGRTKYNLDQSKIFICYMKDFDYTLYSFQGFHADDNGHDGNRTNRIFDTQDTFNSDNECNNNGLDEVEEFLKSYDLTRDDIIETYKNNNS